MNKNELLHRIEQSGMFDGSHRADQGSARGRCEAGNGPRCAGVRSSRSRVVWECSPKRVVNSI